MLFSIKRFIKSSLLDLETDDLKSIFDFKQMISFYFKRSHKCRRIIRENTKFTSCSKNINFSPVLFMKRSQTLFSNFLKIKCAIIFFASYIVLFLLQIKQIISFSKLKISDNYVICVKIKKFENSC